MATISLRFPAGRYHATPWGHHVNEGLIEWPPSPWRILRALVSVGYTSGVWNGAGPSVAARSLIEKLAGALPTYRLPPAVGAHTRHYMPVGQLDKGREKTTLVFDTWAHVGAGELLVRWDAELNPDEWSVLDILVERLGYLGRTESWTVGRLLPDDTVDREAFNCVPDEGRLPLRPGFEQVSLLAPLTTGEFRSWRNDAVARVVAELRDSRRTVSNTQRAKAEEAYPPDLLGSLQVDTNWLKAKGWSQPPGSRRVFYWRDGSALEVVSSKPAAIRRVPPVEAMLLAISSSSGNAGLLPHVSRTLPQAELFHRALVSKVSARSGRHSTVLSGCDEDGRPLRGAHEHAHVLPLDLDGDEHLDHVLVWARMKLDGDAQDAARAIRQTFTKRVEQPLRVAVAAAGTLENFGADRSSREATRLRDLIGSSTTWTSATPFVPPRFLKRTGRNTLAGQVAAELQSRGMPPPEGIVILDPHDNDDARRQRHFVCARTGGPRPPLNMGFTLRLRFGEPVTGPLCLGYGAHFGLGLFRATTAA